MRANIVSWGSGGLSTDSDVLTLKLERAGFKVRFKGPRYRKTRNRLLSLLTTVGVLLAQCVAALSRHPQYDITIFIESMFPEYLTSSRVNCLVVNPEWFRDQDIEHLRHIDYLLCKMPSGVEAFSDLPVKCRNTGFTSPDKRIENFVHRASLKCLHLSARSAVKGTEAVVEAWSRHHEWPELIAVRRARRYDGREAPPLPSLPNVRYETDYIPGDQLKKLQNECEVHALPSQAESYGHVIGEAMGCGAVLGTTDAAPMNELVRPERGLLVRIARSEPMHRSRRNYVDVSDLESTLNTVFDMSPERRGELGRNARAWFEAQHSRFETTINGLLDELRQQTAGNDD